MNENKKEKTEIHLKDLAEGKEVILEKTPLEMNRVIRKMVLYILMGIIFLGCMYLIFSPSSKQENLQEQGLNDLVPQATHEALPTDKGKAYEQELLQQKLREKREALHVLSDYWNNEDSDTIAAIAQQEEPQSLPEASPRANPALKSYRQMQNTLGTFYENQSDNQEEALRKEVETLREQLSEKQTTPSDGIDKQLALMEKSYEMAAKYFPGNATAAEKSVPSDNFDKEKLLPAPSFKKNVVSSLYREPSDSTFLAGWKELHNREFHTVGSIEQEAGLKNSIKACIHDTQTITSGSSVRLRLLERAQLGNLTFPAGDLLTATAKFQNERLQLRIVSIESEGFIVPVDIVIYDWDGQPGLSVPYSPEISALSQMASGMGTTAGTSFTLNSSASEQITADLSKGVIQGVSGYFSKKIKKAKVTLKAGYRVLLVSKK